MIENRFTLSNPPTPKKNTNQTFESNSGKQQVLWTGLKLLPGQLDFFEEQKYDGSEPEVLPDSATSKPR